MGSYYGIILPNDIMELHYAMIFMKRIPGMPGTSPEPPGILGIPWARPWDPQGRSWAPQARPWDPRGNPQGRPWDPLGPPKTPQTTKTAIAQQV